MMLSAICFAAAHLHRRALHTAGKAHRWQAYLVGALMLAGLCMGCALPPVSRLSLVALLIARTAAMLFFAWSTGVTPCLLRRSFNYGERVCK